MSLSPELLQTTREKTAPPKRFGVFLLNDDYTPMDFVAAVLVEIFLLPEDTAERVMWQVHTEGRGLCGTYTRDIAQTKQQQVLSLAEAAGHPLMCIVEEI